MVGSCEEMQIITKWLVAEEILADRNFESWETSPSS